MERRIYKAKTDFCRELDRHDIENEDFDADSLATLLKQARREADAKETPDFLPVRTSVSSTSRAISVGHGHPIPSPDFEASKRVCLKPMKEQQMPVATKKRTRNIDPYINPKQMFKGMVFYFVPNDHVSPARRLKIRKALEFGATHALTFHDCITHVIVDKNVTYWDVLKYMKVDSLPDKIALVNETWISSCIAFRNILDTTREMFQVRGFYGWGNLAPTTGDSVAPGGHSFHHNSIEPSQDSMFHSARIQSSPLRASEQCTESLSQQEKRVPDVLDTMIEQARTEKELLLHISDDENTSDPELESRGLRVFQGNPKWQEGFSCMHKNDGQTKEKNPNVRTIEILQQMTSYYERISDQWRTLAYRKAITALRKNKEKIVSKEQARAIPGIGTRLADKIEEIVWTNRLRRLEYIHTEPDDMLLADFLNIYGVGLVQASKWIASGYRSRTDLMNRAPLTNTQRIGLEHYDDFLERIPRAEVEEHANIVVKLANEIDPSIRITVGGSYRRGADDSGDIDLIFTKEGAFLQHIRDIVTGTLVPILFERGFLKACLSASSRGSSSKWHGVSAVPGNSIWRRIDFLFVPENEFGAALIYFTGNDIFNRSLRLLASKKGMCLNQRGLFAEVLRQSNHVKISKGQLLEGGDEKRIFELLGVPWRPPCHRIC